MLKNLLRAAATIALYLLCFNAHAQTDTTYYDIGRIKVKKDFTQIVTVEGKELEKFPSLKLSESISAWMSGIYTTNNGVLYVIDGDLINDINAYSIFDIEKVTLIQNAIVTVNGAVNQASLIVIQTRRNRPGKAGVTVAGQSNLINFRKTDAVNNTADDALYHLYHIAAYKNTDAVQFGFSADYQHNANNSIIIYPNNVTTTKTPLDRFKLYGYVDGKLGNSSLLSVSLNYVPQIVDNSSNIRYPNSSTTDLKDELRPNFFNADAALQSSISGKLINKLSINYNHAANTENYLQTNQSNTTKGLNTSVSNIFLINEDILYKINAGDWHFDPELNFNLRHVKSDISISSTNSTSGTSYSSYLNTYGTNYNTYLLTPSLNIYYRDVFNLQGGIVYNINASSINPKISPFVTASVDVLRLASVNNQYNWKIFGSYSKSGAYNDASGLLTENEGVSIPQTVYSSSIFLAQSYQSFNNWQLGTTLGLFNNRLNLSYDYEKRQSIIYLITPIPNGNSYINVFSPSPVNSQFQRIGVTGKILTGSKFKWTSTINANRLDLATNLNNYYGIQTGTVELMGKYWAGGGVNRFECDKVAFGADMLYQLDGPSTTTSTSNANSFVLQNAYISYNVPSKNFKNWRYMPIHVIWHKTKWLTLPIIAYFTA